jgi:hypothetical protein
MVKRNKEPIPEEFETIEAAGEFWDIHSLGDYWEHTREVHFEVDLKQSVHLVALEKSLFERLAERAHAKGISTETLIKLWLAERLERA